MLLAQIVTLLNLFLGLVVCTCPKHKIAQNPSPYQSTNKLVLASRLYNRLKYVQLHKKFGLSLHSGLNGWVSLCFIRDHRISLVLIQVKSKPKSVQFFMWVFNMHKKIKILLWKYACAADTKILKTWFWWEWISERIKFKLWNLYGSIRIGNQFVKRKG